MSYPSDDSDMVSSFVLCSIHAACKCMSEGQQRDLVNNGRRRIEFIELRKKKFVHFSKVKQGGEYKQLQPDLSISVSTWGGIAQR